MNNSLRLSLLGFALCGALTHVAEVAAQSKAERVLNTIVGELQRQAERRLQPQPTPVPEAGVWSRRWNNSTPSQSGDFFLTNNSGGPVELGFSRPNGGGSYRRTVTLRTYRRTGLPVGTRVWVSSGGVQQSFNLSGSALSVKVEPGGQMTATSGGLSPVGPPIVPTQTGAIYIKNDSNQVVSLSVSTPPPGIGTWRDTVYPSQEWVRTELAIGSTITVSGARQRSFSVLPKTQRVTVLPDGRITIGGSGGRPWEPIVPPARSGVVVIANNATMKVTASFFPPRGRDSFARDIQPGGEYREDRLLAGTEIFFSSPPSGGMVRATGAPVLRVDVMPDGSLQTSDRIAPPAPSPSPRPRPRSFVITVRNRTGKTIDASYGQRSREIRNNGGYGFAAAPPGMILRIDGDGATASFQDRGTRPTIVALPDGRFDGLPAWATVVSDTPETPAELGKVLLVNRWDKPATLVYRNPTDATPTTMEIAPEQVIGWRSAYAGTTFSLTTSAGMQQATIVADQWTSFLVDRQGVVLLRNTPECHELKDIDVLPVPDDEEADADEPFNDFVNPDPSGVEPFDDELVENPLPKPEATPLLGWVVTNFARRTANESLELVDLLDAASRQRINSIIDRIDADSLNTEELAEAVREGDSQQVRSLSGDADAEVKTRFRDELNDLAGIAAVRRQLVPLREKIADRGKPSAVLPLIATLEQQAESRNDAGLGVAMKRLRRDYAILRTIDGALQAIGVQPTQLSLPQGTLRVIHHPWVQAGNAYFTSTGLVLKDSEDGEVSAISRDAVEVFRLPVADSSDPVDDARTSEVPAIVIRNPASNRAKLVFRVDGRDYSLAPGRRRILAEDKRHTVEFPRNKSGEVATVRLDKAGVYDFTPAGDSWRLVRRAIQVRIDNPRHSITLAYSVNGEQEVLEPGQTALHKGRRPILIAFDQGEGVGIKRKLVLDSGRYNFAISRGTGYWDLYSGPSADLRDTSDADLKFRRATLGDITNARGSGLFDYSSLAQPSGDLFKDLQ